MAKKTKEEWKTYKGVFDNFTLRTLFNLSSSGYFDEISNPLDLGKEANVFYGSKEEGHVCVKIYRLENCNFNKMYDYIKHDPRYSHLKHNKRKTIFAWVQREFRNLMIAKEKGVWVPMPYVFKNNVLVLELIHEEDGSASPRLKDKVPEEPENFFRLVVENMKKLYRAGLVHGDLSEFNILNRNEKPVFIDFSQATPVNTEISKELLERDCRNVCRFFKKFGIEEDYKKLAEKITGKAEESKEK